MLAAAIIPATTVVGIFLMEPGFPQCVSVGINEGHVLLKLLSWSFFCPCLSRILYERMLGHLNSRGISSSSEMWKLRCSAPCLAWGWQPVVLSFIHELVNAV